MRKPIAFIHLFVLAAGSIAAQDRTEDFQISLPEKKIPGSLYNTIRFLDSRYDTTNMGIVQLGAFNKKARVVPKQSFGEQLQKVLGNLNDGSAKEGELLFQLRQFNFAEVTGAVSEKGYCYLRAALYAKNENGYKKIGQTDTVIFIKTMDVTRALFRKGSQTINDFISKSIVLDQPIDPVNYTYEQVMQMDSIEKQSILLYTSPQFTDGLYKTFEAFKNQAPDQTDITVDFKKNKVTVKAKNQKGELEKVKNDDIYSFVHDGKPYIATDYGYYPLERKNDDLYFTGRAKVTANTGDVIVASVFFGIIGGLIASGSADATFEMKIDHINGGFIRMREIK